MKTLILVRHAKSDWQDVTLEDFDRPLNARGKTDAPVMAERLRKRGIVPDLFISSPAKRARKTADIFAEIYDIDKKDILFEKDLYLAPPYVFTEVIGRFKDEVNIAVIFSHNPGITDFANILTNARIDDMPTCAIFAVEADIDSWAAFDTAAKRFLFCDYPKKPQD
ncbi:MAG: phosphohistidine phosphatase [Sphingobacteriales bacterium SCN 48-20]|jgi:phosphohistidine phosphatase|uniref:SixA phosphatase family protein n=1 Tax=Terrimonas ferruginea TaxID=249 RepID=UPI00086833B7|nr:histidine phosphatase family protein [Terrimonas ferruginea]MBN8783543.1 histidine phosphatase family protein [Terrimonas ferruginea]ODT92581.1 MAG: phosphohistidine phosphatase [Sphingobacteriales bacterium SCN 48-20]OJW40298.1 MAG: phosphohistidine phosphatase [Sphingobacteriales bacterium 48-107]